MFVVGYVGFDSISDVLKNLNTTIIAPELNITPVYLLILLDFFVLQKSLNLSCLIEFNAGVNLSNNIIKKFNFIS